MGIEAPKNKLEIKRIELNPLEIAFDKENPRDENKKQIEEEPGFKKLKKDIMENGLLYPVVIKREEADGKKYVLVDGERRLRACQDVKLDKIPVILIEGNFDKRILAYKLHMLSKPWSMDVRVKSINQIVSELKSDGEAEEEILKIVEELTKMPREQIRDILKVLRYPKKVIELIEKQESYRTFLIESENTFIPFIRKDFLDLFEKYGEEGIRKIIGEKLLNKRLGATRSFRDVKEYIQKKCKNKKRIEERIKLFLDNPKMEIGGIIEGVKRDNEEKEKEILQVVKEASVEKGISAMDLRAKLISKEKDLIEINVFDLIFNNLKGAIIEFEKRFDIKIDNEKKLQNVVYTILRSLFMSTEFEDPIGKICEKSDTPDFIIKEHRVILEIKYVRDKNQVYRELAEDYNKYMLSPYGEIIINYVYDPKRMINNHELYKKELNKLFPKALNYLE